MPKRFPGVLDTRAVALLISYDGRLPNVKLRDLMRRCGLTGRATKCDGSANGSLPGYHASRCARYLRSQGLIRFGDGEYIAAVSMADLAAWLADALKAREAHGAREAGG